MDQLVFIVDMNELQDGDLVPISMDYTLNRGPGIRVSLDRTPAVNEWVRLHSDNDDTLLYGQVQSVVSPRDLLVKVDWESCVPVLNRDWSARGAAEVATTSSTANTTTDLHDTSV